MNFIDVQTDRATDTALVQAQIPNPDGILSDGQFVGLTVESEEAQQALVIPQSAVQIDQAGPSCSWWAMATRLSSGGCG